MRLLWPQLASWLDAGEPFALATVTSTSGSTPRAPGSCMAIQPAQARFLGSVSSGCLDIEVVEAAALSLQTGAPQTLRFGPDGRPPWTDGLTCGGWVEVRVEPWWTFQPRGEVHAISVWVREWLERDAAGVVLTCGEHHLAIGPDGNRVGARERFDAAVVARARAHLENEVPPVEIASAAGPVFIRTLRVRPRLILIGGVDVTLHLTSLAREAGFRVIVIDPREAFVTRERHRVPPDELLRAWPEKALKSFQLRSRDVAIALTHDPKIDDPALLALLETRAGYIGALGSTRSHAARLERLRSLGARESELARIHGPAGVHLGTPHAPGIAAGILAGVLEWQAKEERRLALASKDAASAELAT